MVQNVIFNNLLIVLGSLILFSGASILFIKIAGLAFDKALPYLERVCKYISLKIASRFKSKYRMLIEELIFSLSVLMFAYLIALNKIFVILIFPFAFYCMIVGSIMATFKKQNIYYVSIFEWFINLFNKHKEKYLVNRISVFLKELFAAYILLVAILLSYILFLALKWPEEWYFILFLIFPFYSNFWVYFTYKIKLRDEMQINIRRIIMYLAVIIIVLIDAYQKYLTFFKIAEQNFTYFWLNTCAVLFIGIERLLKALSDDYWKYKKQC